MSEELSRANIAGRVEDYFGKIKTPQKEKKRDKRMD